MSRPAPIPELQIVNRTGAVLSVSGAAIRDKLVITVSDGMPRPSSADLQLAADELELWAGAYALGNEGASHATNTERIDAYGAVARWLRLAAAEVVTVPSPAVGEGETT